jgi:hypothetical protein
MHDEPPYFEQIKLVSYFSYQVPFFILPKMDPIYLAEPFSSYFFGEHNSSLLVQNESCQLDG